MVTSGSCGGGEEDISDGEDDGGEVGGELGRFSSVPYPSLFRSCTQSYLFQVVA